MKLSIFSMNRRPDDPAPEETQDTPANGGSSAGLPGKGSEGLAGVYPAGPRYEEPYTQPMASLQDLRQRVLDRIFIAGSLLGVLLLATNLPLLLEGHSLWLLIIYGLGTAAMLFFAFNRQFGYAPRSVILIALLYAVGALILVNDGLSGIGQLLLLGPPIFAAILGGFYSRLSGLIISIGTFLAVGLLMVFGVIPTPQIEPDSLNSGLLYWGTAVAAFALIAVTTTISYGVILEGLERGVERQNSLTLALRRERTALEERVQQRTLSLERRLTQIRTAAEINRSLSRMLNLDLLLPQVCELIRQRFDLYYVGIFLIDSDLERRSGERSLEPRYAVLAAGTGEAGQHMLAENHRLQVGGDSMIGWATANRQARIALDVGKEAVRFSNPFLPRTRSELALPIIGGLDPLTSRQKIEAPTPASEPVWGQSRTPEPGPDLAHELGRVMGALTVQSEVEAAFDQDDILVLQSIADGLASAIENARLFSATEASLEEVRSLHRQYLESAWGAQIEASGELAFTYENQALGEEVVEPAAPSEAGADVVSGNEPVEIPLRLRDQVIGSLFLEPAAGRSTWTPDQQALAEAVATQAALALENARLIEETQRRAKQERAASEITSQLWTSSDMDAILRTVLKELGNRLELSEGWLELWPETPHSQEARHVDN